MKLSDLASALSLTLVAGEPGDREFAGVYAGDLLSRAMSHVKADNVWITIMTNKNVVAVASLADAAAVILAEGTELLPDALEAARENGVSVYSSDKNVYELCCGIDRAQNESV